MFNQFTKILSNLFLIYLISSCNATEHDKIKIEYYDDGSIKSLSLMENMHLHGKSLEFYENGEVSSMKTYINDTLQGRVHYYYDNGLVKAISNVKNSRTDGIQYYYDKKGALNSVSFIENDTVIFSKLYDECGFFKYKKEKYFSCYLGSEVIDEIIKINLFFPPCSSNSIILYQDRKMKKKLAQKKNCRSMAFKHENKYKTLYADIKFNDWNANSSGEEFIEIHIK